MRIFRQFCIDLKSDILFKDTLDYIEEAFVKLGITYDSMGFLINSFSDSVDKVIEKYPVLDKYLIPPQSPGQPKELSSSGTDENGKYTLRVDSSEHQVLRELVKKIPRPYNFGTIAVFLDNVRWFPEINAVPCLEGRYEPIKPSAYKVEYHVKNLAAVLIRAETELSDVLLRLYGKSISAGSIHY